jgi:hypothetical protein
MLKQIFFVQVKFSFFNPMIYQKPLGYIINVTKKILAFLYYHFLYSLRFLRAFKLKKASFVKVASRKPLSISTLKMHQWMYYDSLKTLEFFPNGKCP